MSVTVESDDGGERRWPRERAHSCRTEEVEEVKSCESIQCRLISYRS